MNFKHQKRISIYGSRFSRLYATLLTEALYNHFKILPGYLRTFSIVLLCSFVCILETSKASQKLIAMAIFIVSSHRDKSSILGASVQRVATSASREQCHRKL
jgi:TctA family transporter